MKASTIFFWTITFTIYLGAIAFAQSYGTTTPRLGGGYDTRDNRGNRVTATPRLGGRHDIRDNRGNRVTVTPRLGGGYNTWNSK
jgi:hypothetical protein